jgi:hypothetical protein
VGLGTSLDAASAGIGTPAPPAHSSSLHRLSYPGSFIVTTGPAYSLQFVFPFVSDITARKEHNLVSARRVGRYFRVV